MVFDLVIKRWKVLIKLRVILFVLYAVHALDHVRWPREGFPNACDRPRDDFIRRSRINWYFANSFVMLLTLVKFEKKIFIDFKIFAWNPVLLNERKLYRAYNSKRLISKVRVAFE